MKHVFLVLPASAGVNLAQAAESVLSVVKKNVASAESFVATEMVPTVLQSQGADASMEALVGAVQDSAAEAFVVTGVSLEQSVRSETLNIQIAAALDADVILVADSDENGAIVAADFAAAKTRVAFVLADGDSANEDAVKKILFAECEHRISQAEFRRNLIKLASRSLKRIVLPEGAEPRTLKAAIEAYERKIAVPGLIAKKADVEAEAARQNLTVPAGFEIIEPTAELAEKYVPLLVELRKAKGMTEEKAREVLKDPVFLGTMMLKKDEVDGLVSGAVHSTADTVRPALQVIKCAPGVKSISSVFFVCLPSQVYVFGDCAINLNPTAEELAGIAIQSHDTAKAFNLPIIPLIEGADVRQCSATVPARAARVTMWNFAWQQRRLCETLVRTSRLMARCSTMRQRPKAWQSSRLRAVLLLARLPFACSRTFAPVTSATRLFSVPLRV